MESIACQNRLVSNISNRPPMPELLFVPDGHMSSAFSFFIQWCHTSIIAYFRSWNVPWKAWLAPCRCAGSAENMSGPGVAPHLERFQWRRWMRDTNDRLISMRSLLSFCWVGKKIGLGLMIPVSWCVLHRWARRKFELWPVLSKNTSHNSTITTLLAYKILGLFWTTTALLWKDLGSNKGNSFWYPSRRINTHLTQPVMRGIACRMSPW